jgi:tetratricopeptide (TPR) repeat protein
MLVSHHHLGIAFGLLLGLTMCARAETAAPESDDGNLPGRAGDFARGLIERGMPELLEEFLAGRSRVHRVLLARAYVRAADRADDQRNRERDLTLAAQAYRDAIDAAAHDGWAGNLRRRFSVIKWRVELADLMLRHQSAADLDQWEITRGLSPAPVALRERLADIMEIYRTADASLSGLVRMLENDPDVVVAAGLADDVPLLHRACSLNMAWALTYLAVMSEASRDRDAWLSEALDRFERLARQSTLPAERVNAAIGAAIIYRESGRIDDARRLLEEIVRMSGEDAPRIVSIESAIRARYELGRTALAQQDYDSAERCFAGLREQAADISAFYADIAPLLHGYTLLLKAGSSPSAGGADTENLRRRGTEEMLGVARRGGTWPQIVELYLGRVSPTEIDTDTLDPTERRLAARQWMAAGRFEQASALLRSALADLPPDRDASSIRFDLAVCLSEMGRHREAAVLFDAVADSASDSSMALDAARFAVQSWLKSAEATGLSGDHERTAAAAERLLTRTKDQTVRDELSWFVGTALRRAGRPVEARRHLSNVSRASPRYWHARFAALRCEEELALAATTAETSRKELNAAGEDVRSADGLLSAWDQFTAELERAISQGGGAVGPLKELHVAAALHAAELLAGDRLRRYDEALRRLSPLRSDSITSSLQQRIAAARIRCFGETGDQAGLSAALSDLLKSVRPHSTAVPMTVPEVADASREMEVLIRVAADLDAFVIRAATAGRPDEARRLAEQAIPVVERVVELLEARSHRGGAGGAGSSRSQLAAARFRFAVLLVEAGRPARALPLLDALVDAEPQNGAYLRYQALACDHLARLDGAAPEASRRAEQTWAAILENPRLRDTAPAQYWEARYHWLRWQLERGRAAEVARGIEAERTWHPDLGGSPWRERLLELAEEARRVAEK